MPDFELISDIHKEAYGLRPSSDWMARFRASSDADKLATWESLSQAAADSAREEQEAQAFAIAQFEAHVAKTMSIVVGCTRERAIEIILSAYEIDDRSFVEYELGLPYNYLSGTHANG